MFLCAVDSKLAPIFEKRTKHPPQSSRKSAPVLTEAEKQALEVRRAFLTSGVPEELKRQKPCVFIPVVDACPFVFWPTDSHTQQRPAALVNMEQWPGNCDPWNLTSCDLPCRELAVGNVSPSALLTLGLFTNVLKETAGQRAEVRDRLMSVCLYVL